MSNHINPDPRSPDRPTTTAFAARLPDGVIAGACLNCGKPAISRQPRPGADPVVLHNGEPAAGGGPTVAYRHCQPRYVDRQSARNEPPPKPRANSYYDVLIPVAGNAIADLDEQDGILVKVAAIDVIDALQAGFNLGNAIKYLFRVGRKPDTDPIADLRKARWYIDREITRRTAQTGPTDG